MLAALGLFGIRSNRSLEVIGFYTVASVDADGQLIGGSSLDVEPIPERIPVDGADIEVIKRVSAEQTSPNSTNQVLYSVVVTNNGPTAVEDVQVHDVLDMVAGTLVDVPTSGFHATQGTGWTITEQDIDGVTLDAVIPALEVGESAGLDFMVIVQVDRTQGRTELHNTVEVGTESADPIPDNNTDTLTTVIEMP